MIDTKPNIKMFPGAAAACALPMTLGLAFSLVETFSGGHIDWLVTLPLSLCFLFGTPAAAWIACRYLRKTENPADLPGWGDCFGAGLLGATAVHASAALLHTILLGTSVVSAPPQDFITILFVAALMHLGLWIIITLPFTLLCATIFWRVTKFLGDTDVL